MNGTSLPLRTGRAVRGSQLLVAAMSLLLVAACTPSSGDAGSIPPVPSTPAPSVEPASPDITPGTPEPSATPDGSGSPSASPSPTATPGTGSTIVRAYYYLGSFMDNAGLVPVLREVPRTQAVATAAMTALLEGPIAREIESRPAMYTTVPEGTRLLGLRIENGVATVNLSREFQSGGGSASIFGRLAQVVYTLTQFPTVTGVNFEIDGVPTTVFGGEGVTLDGPATRGDYRDEQLPEIFVDRPAWGAAAGNPLRVTGLTRVFEATFQAQVIDAKGAIIADQTVMATCGTGCWGTFDATLAYDVGASQWGTLRVFEYSAKDGKPTNVTEYPVWLTPAS